MVLYLFPFFPFLIEKDSGKLKVIRKGNTGNTGISLIKIWQYI
jgi:hypothetical protein